MSRRLVFQGGTALPFDIEEVGTLLRRHVAERYGLTVEVKEPDPDRLFDGAEAVVKRWSMKVLVPGFTGKQVIHLEVCNVPAYRAVPTLLQPRYGFLLDQRLAALGDDQRLMGFRNVVYQFQPLGVELGGIDVHGDGYATR